MALDNNKPSKSSKWFSNKSLKLSFTRRRSKSGSSLSSPSSSFSETSLKTLSKEDELREVFRHFDVDGDGKISASELKSYFESIGDGQVSDDEAQRVIDDLDGDGDSLIDFEDFVKMMTMKKCSEDGEDEDLKRAFEMFEMEKGCGCITPKGLQRMLHRLGDARSYDECVAMIRFFDTDGNGVLDFQEFHQMMMT